MAQSLRRVLAATIIVAAAAARTLAAQNPPAVTVGGVVYTQFAGQLDSLNSSNFDVTRAYVNVIGRFSGGFMTRVTADVSHGTGTDGSDAYRLKYAFVNWTPEGSALTYRFGLITTPFIDWEEQLWDYRMQGSVAVDRNSFMTSSDFGAGIDGNINKEMLDFQASVVNGTGYGATPGDMHKMYAARVSVRLLESDDASRVGGLRLTGYAQGGNRLKGGTSTRFIGEASYRSKNILLAGEYVATNDSAVGAAPVKGKVISVYGWFGIPNTPVRIVARYDNLDPNTSAANDQQTRIIGGISYQLSANVRAMADVDHLSFENSARAKITTALFQLQFTF